MVTAKQTLALVDLESRRPTRVPDELRQAVRGLEGADLESGSESSVPGTSLTAWRRRAQYG